MDRIARELGNVDAIRRRGRTDVTVEEMEATVGEFYRQSLTEEFPTGDLALDTDLVDIFNVSKRRRGVRPADDFLGQHRKTVFDKSTYSTGVQRPLARKLIEVIEKRSAELGLLADTKREAEHLTEIPVYASALS